ncbi:MAG TPA: hypothetical protein VLA16_26935 [Ideonella sp.]|nr:hypothetical protein [Ideonella sp.]
MLQLSPEQVSCLEDLAMARGLQRVGEALGEAWPEVPPRLGERYAALVQHGARLGAAAGLVDGLCVARYLSCWLVWGAEFENKPGFEWAREILGDRRRPQGAKVFQLCRRSRDELRRRAEQGAAPTPTAQLPTAAAFDAALKRLDAALASWGTLGSLLPTPPVQLGEACDFDAIDIRLVDSAWRQRYSAAEGNWQRQPCAPEAAQLTLAATTLPPTGAALPTQLTVLSQQAGRGTPARLKLRTRSTTRCDLAVHPMVRVNGPQGLVELRGRHAAELLLTLHAEPAALPPGERLVPALAVESTPVRSGLALSCCGVREHGAAVGELATQLAVYPAEQWLLAWRREASPPLHWPEPASGPPRTPPSRCRIECDGVAVDASRWQAGLDALDSELQQGLARLLTAWERVAGVIEGHLDAEPAVMAGQAGLTWGYAEGPAGIAEPPHLRVEGGLEGIACQLQLRLAGQLALDGSRSVLRLAVEERSEMHLTLQRGAAQPELPAALGPAQMAFRHAVTLQLEPLADEGGALMQLAGPVKGALVGACGLQAHPSGPGLQWFARLAFEAVSVTMELHDPLLGVQYLQRPLLPAMVLLDWHLS